MGKSTISMAIFNSYVKLPEGIRSCNRLEINIFKHHVWCICSCKWQELRMMPFQQEVLQWKTAKPLAVALQINRKMKNLPVSRNVCECIIVQLQNTPGLNSVDFFSATVFEQHEQLKSLTLAQTCPIRWTQHGLCESLHRVEKMSIL